MTASTLLRNEIEYVNDRPVQAHIVYRIDLDPSQGNIDILKIEQDYYVTSISTSCVVPATGFSENATYSLVDVNSGAIYGILPCRAGHIGLVPLQGPNFSTSIIGPTTIRLELVNGIATPGTMQFDIALNGPPTVGIEIGNIIVPFPISGNAASIGTVDDYYIGFSEGPISGGNPSLLRQLGRFLAGQLETLSSSQAASLSGAITALIGGAPTNADTLNELFQLIGSTPSGGGGGATITVVANHAALAALQNLVQWTLVLVQNDGNGLPVMYVVNSIAPPTFMKLVDPSTVAPSAATIKTLYESNANTNAFTDALLAKLSSIAANATANSPDAYLTNRANHTGTQAISTIDGLATALGSLETVVDLGSFTDFQSAFTTALTAP